MTTPHWLAARYRLLMLAYPPSYRRDRGEEMVQIMMDLAAPDKVRPTVREAVNLVLHGFRARLGRSASRSVVAWAVVASVLCGLFAASAASFAAWQTAQPLPNRAQAHELFAELLPGQKLDTQLRVSSAMFVFYEEPLGWQHFDNVTTGDGGELTFGSATFEMTGATTETASVAVERLRAIGWEVAGPATSYGDTQYFARRGNDVIEISFSRQGYLNVSLSRATPWLVHLASIAGFLLGALMGWLTLGWASRRTEHHHPLVRWPASFFFNATMFFWCLPMYTLPFAAYYLISEPYARWRAVWEFIGQPSMSMFFIAGCVTALCGLSLAAIPGGRLSADTAKAATTSMPPTPRPSTKGP